MFSGVLIGLLCTAVSLATARAQGAANEETPIPDFSSNGLWDRTFYHFEIQAKIGRELQSYFEVPYQLPLQLSALLMQFDANC
jgi:hypothetical protein